MSGLSAFLPKSFGKAKVTTEATKTEPKKVDKDPFADAYSFQSFGKRRQPAPSNQPAAKKMRTSNPVSDYTQEEEEEEESIQISHRPTTKQQEDFTFTSSHQKKATKVESRFDYPLPISEHVEMRGHEGAVLAIEIDPAGSRMISGSSDYHIRMWDFAGMLSNFKSFREVEAKEGHPVTCIKWNTTGSEFLLATAEIQPRLYNRDGSMISEYQKGDPYILDMNHTKGHVSAVYNLAWNAEDDLQFLSSSSDSTIRIWDKTRTNSQLEVIKAKTRSNTRVPITTMNCSPYGCSKNLIAAACGDGSLQVWSMQGNHRAPSMVNRNAHQNQTETSSIQIHTDGVKLVSRGGDDTMKIWDLRNFDKPLHVFDQLENAFQQTNCCFSPDGNILVTGTSVRPGYGQGKMLFYDANTLELINETPVCDNSVISIHWHPVLNQVFVGCADNIIRAYHSPTLSTKGVLIGKSRDPSLKKAQGYTAEQAIFTPHSLQMYRPEPSLKRQKIKARKDPIKSRKPDLPVSGSRGHGGNVGSSLTQHLVKNMILVGEAIKDPREALLSYAEKSKSDPRFFGDAYKNTQPTTQFAEYEDEEQ